jgi:uncharacterized protein YciI
MNFVVSLGNGKRHMQGVLGAEPSIEPRRDARLGRAVARSQRKDFVAVACVGVSQYFLVRQSRGPQRDPSRGRREQSGWSEHAAFIDKLSEDGKIPLGGPVGDVDGQHAMLVLDADSEAEARSMFADDPWMDSILRIENVEPWTLWLGPDMLRRSEASPRR